jgi:hypothetical protein
MLHYLNQHYMVFTDIGDLGKKWHMLRTTYTRRRRRKTVSKSGSGATDDVEDEIVGEDYNDLPYDTDAMNFLDPYLSIQCDTRNMVSFNVKCYNRIKTVGLSALLSRFHSSLTYRSISKAVTFLPRHTTRTNKVIFQPTSVERLSGMHLVSAGNDLRSNEDSGKQNVKRMDFSFSDI